MPAVELSDRYDAAVLWPATGYNADGTRAVGAAVQLRVQWDERQGEALDAMGNVIAVDASAVVNRRVPIGSLMAQGVLADWAGTGDADFEATHERLRVVTYQEVPDLKSRFVWRKVGLKRGSDKLTGG